MAQQRQHFALGQAVACLFRLREGADDVVPRFGAPRLDDLEEVLVERLRSAGRDLPFPRAKRRLQQASALCRPRLEPGAVFRRHAEHLGDDDHGQRRGDRLREIEPRQVADGVQQRRRVRADMRLEPGDRTPRECPVDEIPQPRVVRRVQKQHGVVLLPHPALPLPARPFAFARVAGEPPMVPQEGLQEFVWKDVT